MKISNNIFGHINNMQEEIKKIYNSNEFHESCKNFIYNLKSNSLMKIQGICKEIINLRKGKK